MGYKTSCENVKCNYFHHFQQEQVSSWVHILTKAIILQVAYQSFRRSWSEEVKSRGEACFLDQHPQRVSDACNELLSAESLVLRMSWDRWITVAFCLSSRLSWLMGFRRTAQRGYLCCWRYKFRKNHRFLIRPKYFFSKKGFHLTSFGILGCL